MPAIHPATEVKDLTPDATDGDKYDQEPGDAVDSKTNDPSPT